MQQRDPNIVTSSLSRTVTRDGVTVQVRSIGWSTRPSGFWRS